MSPSDQAETEEQLELRRFLRFERLWRDILEAEREAQATARLEAALLVCCPNARQRTPSTPLSAVR